MREESTKVKVDADGQMVSSLSFGDKMKAQSINGASH
jgi:hypothetical protein